MGLRWVWKEEAVGSSSYEWLAMVRWVATQDRTPDAKTQDSGHEI
jgi:hypothetical protein